MAEKIWSTLSNELAETAVETGESVVCVQGRRHPSSGIVYNSQSVVTTNHALRRDDEVAVVVAPGQRVASRVVGRDPGTDLAVLRLEQPIQAPPAKWGESAKLRVGELVLALARTRRGNIVASSGIISGYINESWHTWHRGELDQFIRPDVNFYPGFSGGSLVNSRGEVLGINTAGLHRSGITIPAQTVVRVATELLEKGRIERPYLGLAMQPALLPESLRAKLNLTSSEGLLVMHVVPGSPAEKGGVLLGDVLLEIEHQPVTDTDAVQQQLRSHKMGSEIELALIRGGAIARSKITLEPSDAR